MKETVKFKWQGSHKKRAIHAFLIDQAPGGTSLCGLEYLTIDGDISDEPVMRACGSCTKKINKLKGDL